MLCWKRHISTSNLTRHDGVGRKDLHKLSHYALAILGILILVCLFACHLAYEKAKEIRRRLL